MEFNDIQKRSREILTLFEKHEAQNNTKWQRGDLVRGFVADVGDLSKLTMAEDGLRSAENAKEKLEHELADCLWSVIVIAEKYDVDLEAAFAKTMAELEEKLETKLQTSQ